MNEKVSDRVVDQRLRNRIMEAVHSLAEGVGGWGAMEYFNAFYDVVPYGGVDANTAIAAEEHAALVRLLVLVNRACDATPREVSDEQLTGSSWPDRIAAVAVDVLEIFLRRGRFGEDQEEDQPSVELGRRWQGCLNPKT